MKNFVWILVVLLIILHQDFWFWTDDTLVLGFCPIGLAFHIFLSIAACLTWWLATKFAWPESLAVSENDTADTTAVPSDAGDAGS